MRNKKVFFILSIVPIVLVMQLYAQEGLIYRLFVMLSLAIFSAAEVAIQRMKKAGIVVLVISCIPPLFFERNAVIFFLYYLPILILSFIFQSKKYNCNDKTNISTTLNTFDYLLLWVFDVNMFAIPVVLSISLHKHGFEIEMLQRFKNEVSIVYIIILVLVLFYIICVFKGKASLPGKHFRVSVLGHFCALVFFDLIYYVFGNYEDTRVIFYWVYPASVFLIFLLSEDSALRSSVFSAFDFSKKNHSIKTTT